MKKDRINKKKSAKLPKGLIDRSMLIIIGIFFILIFVKMLMSLSFYTPYILPDEVRYYEQAQHLLEGHLDPINPGYPAILSPAFIFTSDRGISYHIMLFISAIISTSIIFPAYFILKKYCSDTLSIIGSVAVVSLTSINFFSFTLMSENLFTPLFLFSVWFLINCYASDDKKWQILSFISVVYLYITRSDGVAMLVGFVGAFIYYIMINRKNDTITNLISKKITLVALFIISLLAWLIVSHIANPGMQYGSAYDVVGIVGHLADTLVSVNNFVLGIKLFADELIYVFICSYFILTVVIFYYITNFRNINKNDPLMISNVYSIISLFTILVAFVAFRFYASNQEGFIMIGRYVEPIIPLVLILGIICINNMKKMDKKYLYYFIGLFITILAVSLFIMETDMTIIQGFLQFTNNPALFYLEPLYHITLPEVLVSIYALAFLMFMYLSIKNKAYLNGLLILVILSSLIPSLSLYANSVDSSNFIKDNDINRYLNVDSNKTTQLFIDINMTAQQQEIGSYAYGFWNNGETSSIYGDEKNLTSIVKNNNTYLISVNPLPYREIANNYIFKLYQL